MLAPASYHYDPAQKRVTVRGASTVPNDIFSVASDIEILDMSHGHLSSLPPEFSKLTNLRVLFLSHNDFTEIPAILNQCPNLEMLGMKSCKISTFNPANLPLSLRALTLTDNAISLLPPSISRLANLQKLAIAGNLLSDLPKQLLECNKLELIRISTNKFASSPEWLLQLPQLAWYSDAGNPASLRHSSTDHTSIQWADITVAEELGKSPKNIVYKAILKNQQHIAVKVYGSGITADGDPADEIAISLAAGPHSHIISPVAKVIGAPHGQHSLAMNYIPAEFTSLGQPPDLFTFTRDIYPPNKTVTINFICNVLYSVASALEHLHAKGIMHGDIYAHNILVNTAGYAYVGDFGASSLYAPMPGSQQEAIEIRAFTHLLDELLQRCVQPDTLSERHTQLQALARQLRTGTAYSFKQLATKLDTTLQ